MALGDVFAHFSPNENCIIILMSFAVCLGPSWSSCTPLAYACHATVVAFNCGVVPSRFLICSTKAGRTWHMAFPGNRKATKPSRSVGAGCRSFWKSTWKMTSPCMTGSAPRTRTRRCRSFGFGCNLVMSALLGSRRSGQGELCLLFVAGKHSCKHLARYRDCHS